MGLQGALLLIGLLIVAFIWLGAHGSIMKRFRRPPRAVAGHAKSRVEPELDGAPSVLPSSKRHHPVSVHKEAPQKDARPISTIETQTKPVVPSEAVFVPDEKIDFIIRLPGSQAVLRDQALGIYKQNEYVLERPHRMYGLRLPMRLWTNLEKDPPDSQYGDLALFLQLVNREGSATESELNAFSQLGLKLADAFHRPIKFSVSFEEALERANKLHRFCENFDVFASLNIIANSEVGFTGRAIEQAAMRQGLQYGELNIFHMKNRGTEGGRNLFSLANLFKPGDFDLTKLDQLHTRGLALFINVPCVHRPAEVFDKMAETAKALCRQLDGELLDHERRYISDQGLAGIRKHIENIETQMAGQGIVAGSKTALRLFKS